MHDNKDKPAYLFPWRVNAAIGAAGYGFIAHVFPGVADSLELFDAPIQTVLNTHSDLFGLVFAGVFAVAAVASLFEHRRRRRLPGRRGRRTIGTRLWQRRRGRRRTANTPKPGKISAPPRAGGAQTGAGLGTLRGRGYATDGDGLRIHGQDIRLAALDAPEHKQPALTCEGRWIDHGRHVKSRLIERIKGRMLEVRVVDRDKYGRLVGFVTDDRGDDVNEWLVREGLAIAAYRVEYFRAEAHARARGLGMWGMREAYDPRGWRRGQRIPVHNMRTHPAGGSAGPNRKARPFR